MTPWQPLDGPPAVPLRHAPHRPPQARRLARHLHIDRLLETLAGRSAKLYCKSLTFNINLLYSLHCTSLHANALHCIVMYFTALHFTGLNSTGLYLVAVTALHYTAQHCTKLH